MLIIFYASSVLLTINTSPHLRHHPGGMTDPCKCDNVKMPWRAAVNTVMTIRVSVLFLFHVTVELQKESLNTSTLAKFSVT